MKRWVCWHSRDARAAGQGSASHGEFVAARCCDRSRRPTASSIGEHDLHERDQQAFRSPKVRRLWSPVRVMTAIRKCRAMGQPAAYGREPPDASPETSHSPVAAEVLRGGISEPAPRTSRGSCKAIYAEEAGYRCQCQRWALEMLRAVVDRPGVIMAIPL